VNASDYIELNVQFTGTVAHFYSLAFKAALIP